MIKDKLVKKICENVKDKQKKRSFITEKKLTRQ